MRRKLATMAVTERESRAVFVPKLSLYCLTDTITHTLAATLTGLGLLQNPLFGFLLRFCKMGDLGYFVRKPHLSSSSSQHSSQLVTTRPSSYVRNTVKKRHNLPDYQIVPLTIKIKLGRI